MFTFCDNAAAAELPDKPDASLILSVAGRLTHPFILLIRSSLTLSSSCGSEKLQPGSYGSLETWKSVKFVFQA